MRTWIDLLPGWPADEVEGLVRAGHLVVVDERPRGLRAPVALRVADDLSRVLPGDVALRLIPGDLEAFAAACAVAGAEPWAVVGTPAESSRAA